jgi:SAM-dependent methyltransferase
MRNVGVLAAVLGAGLAAAQLAPGPWAAPGPVVQLQYNDVPGKEVPYVPTPPEVVDVMLDAAGVKKGDVLYDLGCGDGRIVIAAAKRFGVRGVGVDIDPQRIQEANENAKAAGVTDLVEFREQNLFDVDLRPATVVTLYLLSSVNLKLRPKLLREVRPGTRVVSHAFDMGDWAPDQELAVGHRTVYLWRVEPEDKAAAR